MPRDRNPNCFHVSASAIAAFKACPTRFRLAYREGLRLADDTDAQRMGTNWHALHEVYNQAFRESLASSGRVFGEHDTTENHEEAYAAAVGHLNERYAEVPGSKTAEEWEIERLVLITSFHVYLWYYADDPVESLAEEVAFDLPIHEPRTGLPLPISEALRVGKIDTVVKWRGMVGNREMKSTASSIDADSKYWEKSQKDTQVSMYALAMHDLASSDQLPESVKLGMAFGESFGNTLYDVWRKPRTKPTLLTQKATADFIESGTYFEQEFEVESAVEDDTPVVRVGEYQAFVKPGKKGFAIRETPRMYAARLMDEMVNDPTSYFVRKEIARTDKDLAHFRVELYRTYQAMRALDRQGCWYENEHQCRATFTCAYVPICYGPGADAVCATGDTPPAFKRIFNVTVEGEGINDADD